VGVPEVVKHVFAAHALVRHDRMGERREAQALAKSDREFDISEAVLLVRDGSGEPQA
jgi:hypothetical protein